MVETPAVHGEAHGEAVAESVDIKLGLIFEFFGRHKTQNGFPGLDLITSPESKVYILECRVWRF